MTAPVEATKWESVQWVALIVGITIFLVAILVSIAVVSVTGTKSDEGIRRTCIEHGGQVIRGDCVGDLDG